MRCDTCGWRISKKNYEGQGECYSCFDGEMMNEYKRSSHKGEKAKEKEE